MTEFKTEASKQWQKGAELARNSPINKVSNNGYITGTLNLISGTFATTGGIGSLTTSAETGGLSFLPGFALLSYGLTQMGIGTMQIVNQAMGNKKDVPSGPCDLSGKVGDRMFKTNGTLEKAGEYIDMGVSFKSTFLGQGLRLLDRTANGTSLFLGVTDKALENKPDEQK